MDAVFVRDFRVDAVIGVLDHERVTPQPLEIELTLELDLDGAAGGDLKETVDYAAVVDQVSVLAAGGCWHLLESLGTAICRLLLASPRPDEERAQVESVEVVLRKPVVLGGSAVPGVRMTRDKAWAKLPIREVVPGVVIETIHKTQYSAAYRCHLMPGASWHTPERVSTCVIGGSPVISPGRISNEGTTPACVLVVGQREPVTE